VIMIEHFKCIDKYVGPLETWKMVRNLGNKTQLKSRNMLKHLGLLLDTLHLYYARFKKISNTTGNCRVQI
jgi:hypothetical protein